MRGDVKVVNDVDVTEEMVSSSHLVLFGDPGSNLLLRTILAASTNRVPDGTEPPVGNSKLPPIDAQVAAKLPFDWNSREITIGSKSWPADSHGLCLIFPNPFNRRKYIVLNTGHTFGEQDFKASNAWLFPRMGDVGVLKLSPGGDGRTTSTLIWSDTFGTRWLLR